MRKARARGGEAEVEGEHEIERAAKAVAVDQCHRETRQTLDLREHLLPEPRELLRLARREALHLRHIRAGGEDVGAAGAEDPWLPGYPVARFPSEEDIPQFI